MSSHAHKLSSLSVFYPCYNEAENVRSLLSTSLSVIAEVAEQFELIVVNDGSQDQTADIVKAMAQDNPQIRLVSHDKNLGYGASLRSGFAAAQYQWIFFTDGDNQFDIAQIKEFVAQTSTHACVIGYRVNRAEGSLRALNARLFKHYVDALFRLHVKDIDCAFKLIRADLIKSLLFQSTGAMISAELLYRLKKKGVQFKQLPVNHYPRRFGTPTGNNPKVVVKALYEALRLYLSMKKQQVTQTATASAA